MLVWLFLSLTAVLQGGRCYSHYYIQLAPSLALAAAPCASYLTKGRTWEKGLLIVLASVILLAAFTARLDIPRTYELVKYPNRNAVPTLKQAGHYIREKTGADDLIYAWGWATPIYHFAKRQSASRFLISDYASGRIFGTGNSSRQKKQYTAVRKSRMLLVSDIQKKRPLYFIDTSPSGLFGYDRFPLSSFPELNKIISRDYIPETVIEKMILYRRRETPGN